MELYNQSPSCGLDSCRAAGVSKYVSNGQFKLDQSFDAHPVTPSQTMNLSPNSSDSYTVQATQYGVFFKCNVCNINCTSQVSFEQHLSGALHRKNVQPHVQWKCQLCNLEFVDCSQLEAHMQGSRHARKVKRTTLNESDQSDESSTKSTAGESTYCSTCQLLLSSNSQFQSHVAGRRHQNRMKLLHHYSTTEPVGIRTPQARQSSTSRGMCSLRLSSACKNVATQTDIDCVVERIQVSESGVSPAHLSVVPCYLQAYGSDSSTTVNSPSNSTSSATPSQPLCAHESCIISRALELEARTQNFRSARNSEPTSSFEIDQPDERFAESRSQSFYCPTCQINLNSKAAFLKHVAGRTHHNRTKQCIHSWITERMQTETPVTQKSNKSSHNERSSRLLNASQSSSIQEKSIQTTAGPIVDRILHLERGLVPAHSSVSSCFFRVYDSNKNATLNSPSTSTSSATPFKMNSSKMFCTHESCIISRALESYVQSLSHNRQNASMYSFRPRRKR